MSDYPMLISNKLHSFRNFEVQTYTFYVNYGHLHYFFLGTFHRKVSFDFLSYRIHPLTRGMKPHNRGNCSPRCGGKIKVRKHSWKLAKCKEQVYSFHTIKR